MSKTAEDKKLGTDEVEGVDPEKGSTPRPRRINVAVSDETVAAIQALMDRENVSLTEAVRKLIGYGEFVYKAIREDGSDVVVRNGEKEREIVLLS